MTTLRFLTFLSLHAERGRTQSRDGALLIDLIDGLAEGGETAEGYDCFAVNLECLGSLRGRRFAFCLGFWGGECFLQLFFDDFAAEIAG